ncbi:MAG: Crp/Fnr family transcriptional regulator [Gammaproteobacteria bacterium]|nr:Crp/Fnr family transcriptional regulator [Gammaproteobacteria bacterium]
MSANLELLRHVDLFGHLTDEQLSILDDQARTVQFRKNAIVMTEGDAGESMYVIVKGLVKVFVSDSDGKELVLYQEGPGSVIGDIALLDDEPRSASVSTLEDTSALMISKPSFQQCLHDNPDMAIRIIRSLTLRLRQATEGSRSLALNNVYRRLADKLLELSINNRLNETQLPKKYAHQELGNMIGASREMVGKVMAELIKGEYIEMRDGIIYILKKFPKDW